MCTWNNSYGLVYGPLRGEGGGMWCTGGTSLKICSHMEQDAFILTLLQAISCAQLWPYRTCWASLGQWVRSPKRKINTGCMLTLKCWVRDLCVSPRVLLSVVGFRTLSACTVKATGSSKLGMNCKTDLCELKVCRHRVVWWQKQLTCVISIQSYTLLLLGDLGCVSKIQKQL